MNFNFNCFVGLDFNSIDSKTTTRTFHKSLWLLIYANRTYHQKSPGRCPTCIINGPEYLKFENTKIAGYVDMVARWKWWGDDLRG